MNKHMSTFLSLILITSSAIAYAETETIISRITQITDEHILIDGSNERAKPPVKLRQSTTTNFDVSGSSTTNKTTYIGPTKFDLVTEGNQHLSPYPLTEFWINTKKSDHKTFKGIGYTHEAEITIEDGTVKKIRTLDDYIL